MKRIIAAVLAALMILSLCACGSDDSDTKSKKKSNKEKDESESQTLSEAASENDEDSVDEKEAEVAVMDRETLMVSFLLREALNLQLYGEHNVVYDGVRATDPDLNVETVLKANDLVTSDNYFTREIGGETYSMAVTDDHGFPNVKLVVGSCSSVITNETKISDFQSMAENAGEVTLYKSESDAPLNNLSVMKADADAVNLFVKEALNEKLANAEGADYNGVPVSDDNLTVGDVMKAYGVTTSDAFYTRKIDGEDYSIVYTTKDGIIITLSGGDYGNDGTVLSDSMTLTQILRDAGLIDE